MYKELTKEDIKKILKFPETYAVDALIVVGTHPKTKEYPHIYEALEKLKFQYTEEKIEDSFFGEIKSFIINKKRIWFEVVYGTSYLSEVVHVASLLGSQANLLLGSCGALQDGMRTQDTILPMASYGNESSTRMYQRNNKTYLYESDVILRSLIKKYISKREKVHEGNMISVQAMLAETKEDVVSWNDQGYIGVDMESATLFSTSNHFNIPSAALLYVADNLIKNELVTDDSFELLRTQRIALKKENYEIALRVILEKLN